MRDGEFERQLHARLELAEQEKLSAVELAETKAAGESQKDIAARDAGIQDLKAKLDAGEAAQKLAVTEALSPVEKERDALASELELAKQDKLPSRDHTASECSDELVSTTPLIFSRVRSESPLVVVSRVIVERSKRRSVESG